GHETRAVLAACAVEDHGAVRVGDRGDRGTDALAVPLEDLDVELGPVADRVVGSDVVVDVVAVVGVEHTEEGHMADVDVDVARRIVRELLRPAQVDDALDPVLRKRTPAVFGQVGDVVCANEDATSRLAAPCKRHSAQITDVEAALPAELTRHAAAGSAPRYASITAGLRCTSSGVPSAIFRPKSSTWIRSATPITRPMWCSTRSTVKEKSSRIVWMKAPSAPTSSWFRPPAGSSSRRRRGSATSARASSTRFSVPNGSPLAGRSATAAIPT